MREIKNKAFLMYFNEEDVYRDLTDEQAGKLLKAMYRYAVDGEKVITPQNNAILWGVFHSWRVQYDQDNAKYIEQARKKRERDNERYQREKEKLKEGQEANSPLPFDYEPKDASPAKHKKFLYEDDMNSDEPF